MPPTRSIPSWPTGRRRRRWNAALKLWARAYDAADRVQAASQRYSLEGDRGHTRSPHPRLRCCRPSHPLGCRADRHSSADRGDRRTPRVKRTLFSPRSRKLCPPRRPRINPTSGPEARARRRLRSAGSGWQQARRWPCGQESHATWGWGRASPKARQAVAEECGALRHRCLERQASSSDEHGPPTALLDHRKHASDEREGAPASGGVDLGDGGGSRRADGPSPADDRTKCLSIP